MRSSRYDGAWLFKTLRKSLNMIPDLMGIQWSEASIGEIFSCRVSASSFLFSQLKIFSQEQPMVELTFLEHQQCQCRSFTDNLIFLLNTRSKIISYATADFEMCLWFVSSLRDPDNLQYYERSVIKSVSNTVSNECFVYRSWTHQYFWRLSPAAAAAASPLRADLGGGNVPRNGCRK